MCRRIMKKFAVIVICLVEYVTSWYIFSCSKINRRTPKKINWILRSSIHEDDNCNCRLDIDQSLSSSLQKAIYDTAQQLTSLHRDKETNDSFEISLQRNVAMKQQLHLNLVKKGKLFEQTSRQHSQQCHQQQKHLIVYPQRQRVPGCIANVELQVTLIPVDYTLDNLHNHTDPTLLKVKLDGDADALISKGLLATLASLVSYESVYAQDILQLDPHTLSDLLGLRSSLSSGRNDGIASMMRVIQDQIRSLLLQYPHRTAGEPQQEDTITHSTQDDIFQLLEEPLEKTKTDIHSIPNKDLTTRKPTVAMLLSGGVDSSVALHLLLQQQYNVTAFYLKIWLEDELAHLGQCPWEDDYKTCQSVCEHASQMYRVPIILESISLQKEYKERVISYTIQEAKKGRTPNPDIMCNSRVKFGCFYDAIQGRGFDYVATGHYAMLSPTVQTSDVNKNNPTPMALLQSPDPIKDQTYFLSALTQSQLQRVLFPVGSLLKTQVRTLASQLNLPNKDRRDSQGLCFLGKVKFDEFLQAYLGHEPGDIVDAHSGEIIGRHNGLWFHTVGQRKGIGKVLNPKATSIGPWYVVAKDPQRRVIFASNQYDEEIFTQARSEFDIEDIHWISGHPPLPILSKESLPLPASIQIGRFMMKIRHGSTLIGGSLVLSSDTSRGHIRLDTKDKGLAPGQYVVFYLEGQCLGSGVISESHWDDFSLTI